MFIQSGEVQLMLPKASGTEVTIQLASRGPQDTLGEFASLPGGQASWPYNIVAQTAMSFLEISTKDFYDYIVLSHHKSTRKGVETMKLRDEALRSRYENQLQAVSNVGGGYSTGIKVEQAVLAPRSVVPTAIPMASEHGRIYQRRQSLPDLGDRAKRSILSVPRRAESVIDSYDTRAFGVSKKAENSFDLKPASSLEGVGGGSFNKKMRRRHSIHRFGALELPRTLEPIGNTLSSVHARGNSRKQPRDKRPMTRNGILPAFDPTGLEKTNVKEKTNARTLISNKPAFA